MGPEDREALDDFLSSGLEGENESESECSRTEHDDLPNFNTALLHIIFDRLGYFETSALGWHNRTFCPTLFTGYLSVDLQDEHPVAVPVRIEPGRREVARARVGKRRALDVCERARGRIVPARGRGPAQLGHVDRHGHGPGRR